MSFIKSLYLVIYKGQKKRSFFFENFILSFINFYFLSFNTRLTFIRLVKQLLVKSLTKEFAKKERRKNNYFVFFSINLTPVILAMLNILDRSI